jgi:acyl carrier protein
MGCYPGVNLGLDTDDSCICSPGSWNFLYNSMVFALIYLLFKYFDISLNKFYFAPSFLKNKENNMSDIASKVKAIIIDKLGVDEKEVTQEASFTNDLGADSLDTVELIMEFEKEFNIAIPDDQAEKIATVGQAIEYIEKNVK